MNKKFYLTTAIPYVNAPPHLGFALEVVQADVVARYHQLLGKDVYFLAGTDENALKNVQAAEKEGITTKQLVDRNSQKFYDLKKALNLTYDDFIRTTERRHLEGSQALWQACKKEDVYKKKYKGLYCVGCEAFYTKKDLIDGKCPEHKKKPEVVEEENYFFRLSKYQDWLEDLVSTDKLKIVPQTRKNEVLSFIRRGLEDFSISRTIERAHGWGIPVPNDPSQIIYVWFDALANYITALGWHKKDKLFQKYWPADLHVIGKGITRFHAIYWPAMLKSAGIPLPKEEFVHGYITIEGEKISKSLGNVIDPFELVNQHGTDAIRYYLLREIPAYGDGDFSTSRFKELYNADLANGLGNLVARVLTLVEKNCGAKVPQVNQDPDSHPLRIDQNIHNWKKTWQDIDNFLPQYKFNEALESIWKFIKEADKYIDQNKPWELVKKDKKKFNWVLYGLLDSIHQLAWQIYPFMSNTAQQIAKRLKIEKLLIKNPLNKNSWTNIKPGTKIKAGKSLFPRIK
ncbi:methionine--tRNA ligase [Candidatus Microgenomates bacterium]|nr:methionine--tRNA ligase [Candidatus Microgenomates bacterium]